MAHLSEAEHLAVSAAVSAAEGDTAGEIVTIVTDRSDGYSDVALVWAAVVAFTAIAMLTTFPHFYLGIVDLALGKWNADWTPRGIFGLALLVGILKFLGMWLIQLWQPLKFFLIPGPIKSRRVNARAVDLFKVGTDRRTTGRTGILIYLSMREHRAEIVADEAIASQVAPETWGDAMAAMLEYIRQGRVADGMIAAIETNFPHREISDAAFEHQAALEKGERIMVGVNAFQVDDEAATDLHRPDPAAERRQKERLAKTMASRDDAPAAAALEALGSAAASDRNLMPPLIECARARVSEGEMIEAMQRVFGTYTETPVY